MDHTEGSVERSKQSRYDIARYYSELQTRCGLSPHCHQPWPKSKTALYPITSMSSLSASSQYLLTIEKERNIKPQKSTGHDKIRTGLYLWDYPWDGKARAIGLAFQNLYWSLCTFFLFNDGYKTIQWHYTNVLHFTIEHWFTLVHSEQTYKVSSAGQMCFLLCVQLKDMSCMPMLSSLLPDFKDFIQ